MSHSTRPRKVRLHWFRRGLLTATVATIIGGAAWLCIFSDTFVINDIRVSGVSESLAASITGTVRGMNDNLLVLRPVKAVTRLMERYGSISQVVVTKHYPHVLEVFVTEREPVGIWCHGQECAFWDRTGAQWGETFPSTGPLLLFVQDERSDRTVQPALLTGLLTVVDGLPELGLHARSLRLPDDEPGGVRVITDKKYELYMDALGDVADQLAVLGVFLADKAKDPAFSPQYIDIRTSGRVYYK